MCHQREYLRHGHPFQGQRSQVRTSELQQSFGRVNITGECQLRVQPAVATPCTKGFADAKDVTAEGVRVEEAKKVREYGGRESR